MKCLKCGGMQMLRGVTMTELKFFPISKWHITNCKSETDNRKYIVKMIGNKGKLFVMKGTEIMTDMAYGQFVSEFAIL